MKAALVALMLLAQAPQQPPQNCGDRVAMLKRLAAEPHHEGIVARALNAHGWMVETTANRETGTWTELTTTPNGRTCVTDVGEGWTAVDDEMPKDEA